MTAAEWVLLGVAWCLSSLLFAAPIAKFIAHDPHDADVCECWDDYEPPTSVPQRNDDWMALISVDNLRDEDPLLHERFYALVDSTNWSAQ